MLAEMTQTYCVSYVEINKVFFIVMDDMFGYDIMSQVH